MSRNVHHTTLRISSSSSIQKAWEALQNERVDTEEPCGSRLTASPTILPVSHGLHSQGDDVKLLGILKNDGDGPSGASRSSKTFPEVSNEILLCGKQESRPIIPLKLRILEGWLGTWDIPELLGASGS